MAPVECRHRTAKWNGSRSRWYNEDFSLADAQIYDPRPVTEVTGGLDQSRLALTATLLSDGEVSLIGGENDVHDTIGTALLHLPPTGVWG